MLKSWGTIIQTARDEIWPFPAEAKPQRAAHTKFFAQGAMDLQQWIPELTVKNTSVFEFGATYFQCGKTVVCAPVGDIRRVYTIVGDEWCDPVFYRSVPFKEVECWSNNLLTYDAPLNVGLPSLPMGLRSAEATSDSICGRGRAGIWAWYRHRIHIAPWIQSNEKVVVEWDGQKKEWDDTDQLETDLWDEEVIDALKLFVKWKHEQYFGCDRQKRKDMQQDFEDLRAKLIAKFQAISEQKPAEECCNDRLRTQAELEDDEVTVASDDTILAFIADYDGTLAAAQDVAALVIGWDPAAILTGGDNIYGNTDAETNIGGLYGDYITANLLTNRFWPALLDHDWDDLGIQNWYDYFRLPNNERYYDVVIGSVHVFVVDGTTDEPDGRAAGTTQYEYFRVKMALSTAKWKVVVVGSAPYTTAAAKPGDSVMRWPFKDWGADLVLSGNTHAYERFEGHDINVGLPFVVGGWSGRSLESVGVAGDTEATVKKVYNTNYGAVRLTADCDELLVEAINRDGETIDTLTIS